MVDIGGWNLRWSVKPYIIPTLVGGKSIWWRLVKSHENNNNNNNNNNNVHDNDYINIGSDSDTDITVTRTTRVQYNKIQYNTI